MWFSKAFRSKRRATAWMEAGSLKKENGWLVVTIRSEKEGEVMSRALVPEGTVRIGKDGVVSLARDLFVAPRLILLHYDQKTKKMFFRTSTGDGIKVYKSSPGAQSGTFHILSVLKLYGLEDSVVGHRYEAQIKGTEFVINFGREFNAGTNGTKNGSRR